MSCELHGGECRQAGRQAGRQAMQCVHACMRAREPLSPSPVRVQFAFQKARSLHIVLCGGLYTLIWRMRIGHGACDFCHAGVVGFALLTGVSEGLQTCLRSRDTYFLFFAVFTIGLRTLKSEMVPVPVLYRQANCLFPRTLPRSPITATCDNATCSPHLHDY